MVRPSTLPNLCFYHYPVKGEHVIDDILAELLTLTVTTDVRGYTSYTNQDGKLHRIHGPAVTRPNGTRVWYQNGQLHRTDGPAVVFSHGERQYWINGRGFTENEFRRYQKSAPSTPEHGSVLYNN